MSAPTCAQRLQASLKDLRLPSMRGCFQETAERARAEALSYEEYLLELTTREQQVRRQHRVERALRESGLPLEKTLAGLDRTRLPRTVDAHVNALLEGTFLDRYENVLAFGSPDVVRVGSWDMTDGVGGSVILSYADAQLSARLLFFKCPRLAQLRETGTIIYFTSQFANRGRLQMDGYRSGRILRDVFQCSGF